MDVVRAQQAAMPSRSGQAPFPHSAARKIVHHASVYGIQKSPAATQIAYTAKTSRGNTRADSQRLHVSQCEAKIQSHTPGGSSGNTR
mmetsp:Transcript_23263/g.72478  ORF Transcript_23263/g.72478 Transcript_23263/m.72478 type:complete len:87 (-) Transcript_23263:768-1028(-)